jgi:hypothetical protein
MKEIKVEERKTGRISSSFVEFYLPDLLLIPTSPSLKMSC